MVQSFNRVDDPILDQSGAKLIGAAAGGYGGWKHHQNIAKNRGIISKITLGLGTGPIMGPARTLAGAGLGALGAGVLARFLNKKHKDRQNRQLIKGMSQVPYYPRRKNAFDDNVNAGTQTYDEYADNNMDFSKFSSVQDPRDSEGIIARGVHGGLLGGLGGAILGFSPVRSAGIGALGLLGYDAYKKYKKAQQQQPQQQQLQPQQQQYQGYYPYG